MSNPTEGRKFFAAIKKYPQDRALSITFHAKDTGHAISEMLKAAGVDSTAKLYEFDLMEVIGAGQYRPVSSRLAAPAGLIGTSSLYTAGSTTPPTFINPLPLPALTLEGDSNKSEEQYTPYSIATA